VTRIAVSWTSILGVFLPLYQGFGTFRSQDHAARFVPVARVAELLGVFQ